jgi:hypothetical protein
MMLIAMSCAPSRHAGPAETVPGAALVSLDQRVNWDELLGQRVTVEGEAQNWKLGAQVRGKRAGIWVDGLDGWPEEYWRGEGTSRRVRVTGTVVQRHDLPVFRKSDFPDGRTPGGIPVGDDVDLHEAAKRYLLEAAVWRSSRD